MNNIRIKHVASAVLALVGLAGCASGPSPAELDRQATAMMKASFRDQGIARVDRLDQDPANEACSHMPRFGHKALLDEKQLKDIMALLLDPKSPVNQ